MRAGSKTAAWVLAAAAAALAAAPAVAEPRWPVQRCVNIGNALDAPSEGEWSVVIDLEWFAMIKAAGFDTVRIPVRWSAHLQGPDDAIDPAFRDRVDVVLRAALDAGLEVVVNVHHFVELAADAETHAPRLLAMWAQIAPHYADWPEALHFELINEPHWKFQGDIMRETLLAGLEVVRRSNPTRTVILGGEFYSGAQSLPSLPPVDDPNVVFTVHYYEPFEFTHQRAPWVGEQVAGIERGWGDAADHAALNETVSSLAEEQAAFGRPVFLGEFGAYEAGPYEDRIRYIRAVRKAFEKAGMGGWCLWSFTDTFPLWDRETGFDPNQMKALGLAPAR